MRNSKKATLDMQARWPCQVREQETFHDDYNLKYYRIKKDDVKV